MAAPENGPEAVDCWRGGGAKAEVDLVYPSGQLAFFLSPSISLSHFPFLFFVQFLLPAT